MKKCSNCGYPSLDDNAKKCRCGAIVDNTLFHCIVTIFVLSIIESIFITIGLITLNNNIDREDSFLYLFLILYLSQALIFYFYNKNRIKKSGAKITEFTPIKPSVFLKKNENYSSRVVDLKQEEPKNCHNGNGFITGVVAGVVINEILDND